MNIADFLNKEGQKRGFSFEVLPPLKGNGTAALFRTIDSLKEFDPRFINITTHHSEYVYKELVSVCVDVLVPSPLQEPYRTSTIFL